MIYLYFWIKDFKSNNLSSSIPIKYFLLCAIVDVHATLFIVYAYNYTSITSVMLLEDFTIPAAALLSIFFLKIKYSKTHFFALTMCFCGMAVSLYNDLILNKSKSDSDEGQNSIVGDFMALSGAFLYALSNILQEHFLKKQRDIFHYLGFLGLFGTIITIIEAIILSEFDALEDAIN